MATPATRRLDTLVRHVSAASRTPAPHAACHAPRASPPSHRHTSPAAEGADLTSLSRAAAHHRLTPEQHTFFNTFGYVTKAPPQHLAPPVNLDSLGFERPGARDLHVRVCVCLGGAAAPGDIFQLVFPGLLKDCADQIIGGFDRVWAANGGGHDGKVHDGKRRSAILPFPDQDAFLSSLLDEPRLWGPVSRQRDCHFTSISSPSALKNLLKGEGGAAE